MLCTVHILYGSGKAEDPRRLEEIRLVVDSLRKRARKYSTWSRNIILLGDFNIFERSGLTMKVITEAGFEVPDELQEVPRRRYYDQIAFVPTRRGPYEDRLESTGQAGVFNFFDYVYRDVDQEVYSDAMASAYRKTKKGKLRDAAGRRRHYRTWRTFQMSDHSPMCLELKTDFSREYLESVARR